jgi:hypothetical protein
VKRIEHDISVFSEALQAQKGNRSLPNLQNKGSQGWEGAMHSMLPKGIESGKKKQGEKCGLSI